MQPVLPLLLAGACWLMHGRKRKYGQIWFITRRTHKPSEVEVVVDTLAAAADLGNIPADRLAVVAADPQGVMRSEVLMLVGGRTYLWVVTLALRWS